MTDILDAMVVIIQEQDLGFDVGRHDTVGPRHEGGGVVQNELAYVSHPLSCAQGPFPAVSEVRLFKIHFPQRFAKHCNMDTNSFVYQYNGIHSFDFIFYPLGQTLKHSFLASYV